MIHFSLLDNSVMIPSSVFLDNLLATDLLCISICENLLVKNMHVLFYVYIV